MLKKILSTALATTMLTSMVAGVSASETDTNFEITSPYASVNWNTYGQYKADFHSHSNESDGAPQPFDTVEEHYRKGFDVLALTDHNVTNTTWDRQDDPTGKDRTYLTSERLEEITNGTDRQGKGMVSVPNSDEQSMADHLNTFWTPYNNVSGSTLANNMAAAENLGGISHLNHPGRYTGGRTTANNGLDGAAISSDPTTVAKYVDLLMQYKSCVGMEIINKLDGDSYSDRILWDNILMETMPEGRFVWGFSNDDTHANQNTGHSYNMMLMPENTEENVRTSMETGAFYASAKVAKREGLTETNINVINAYQPPVITDISVDDKEDTISIEGRLYNEVQWVADGKVIATGNTLDLDDYADEIGSYVRAQLIGNEGVSFTQPFAVEVADQGAEVNMDKEVIFAENEEEVTATISIKDAKDATTFDVSMAYDATKFDVVSVDANSDKVIFEDNRSTEGNVRVIFGASEAIKGDLVKITLKAKAGITTGAASFDIDDVSIAAMTANGTATEATIEATKDATVRIASYANQADLNRDGKITLADLAIALDNYKGQGAGDINLDGTVDTADFITISSYIA